MRISDWSSDVCSSDLHDSVGDIVEQPVDACGRFANGEARRARDRGQKPLEPLAAFRKLSRDDRRIAMHFCPDMGSDKANDTFGLGGLEPVAGIDPALPPTVEPPNPVRGDPTPKSV